MAKARKSRRTDVEEKQPTVRTCGTMEVHERLLRTVPGYREARDAVESHAWRAAFTGVAGRTGCTRIPVVVHVVHRTAAQNIADAQIESQIDVLSADFRAANADIATVPAAFQPLIGDARVTFALATTDPDGNPTNGITRTQTTVVGFTQDDAVKSDATGGADAWPSDRFLNIWVCQLAGSLLGYAQFPGGAADTDGVVILHSAFGTTGTATAPFDLGRTTTHEVGHWLNLRHIWGDDGTGCLGSDFVDDTPNQGGANTGTPVFPSLSCSNGPNGDMFMNFMDYTDDVAMVMFTVGQVARMQATLDGVRSTIGTAVPCGPKPIKEGGKDWPKDPPKDLPKDPPKEFPKDLPKDWPKEFPKDPPKDLPKDPPKEFPKDLPKDWPKERPKDLPKEGPFDPPKGPFDPPKGPFDPPKGPFDPPKGPFDPPKGPFDPPKGFVEGGGGWPPFVVFPQAGGGGPGAVPFVLATSASASDPAAAAGAQYHLLASAYARLLSHYARLYSAGLLDASAMAAWQELAMSYQAFSSSGGPSGRL